MDSKKSVYFVLPSMVGGGAEKAASTLLNTLDRKKFILKLILFNKMGEYLSDIPSDIEIFDLNKKSRTDFLKLIFKLRKIIKKNRPDILFSFLHYTNIVTVLSGLFLKNNTRTIISEHSYHRLYLPHARLRTVKRLLIRFTYNKACKIIAISDGIRKILIRDFNIKKTKIELIYNPIDIQKIQALKREKVSHPFFDKKNNHFVLISVGRLTMAKNFSLLINALATVIKKAQAYLLILGQGELEKDLRALTEQLGVEKFVDFVGFQKNPFSWIKNADLFVCSSLWEGMSMALVEAMACGAPNVSTRCPSGPEEIITDGINGLLVPTNDAKSLSTAILRLIKNKDLRKHISEAGKKKALDFDLGKIIKTYEKCFEEV